MIPFQDDNNQVDSSYGYWYSYPYGLWDKLSRSLSFFSHQNETSSYVYCITHSIHLLTSFPISICIMYRIIVLCCLRTNHSIFEVIYKKNSNILFNLQVVSAKESGFSPTDIAIFVIPLLVAILVIAGIVLIIFLMMARKKRATRGTYSPSANEFQNPRLELENVLKIPQQERLI